MCKWHGYMDIQRLWLTPPQQQMHPTLPSSRALNARKSRVACSGSISRPHSGSAVPSTGTGLPPLTSWTPRLGSQAHYTRPAGEVQDEEQKSLHALNG